MGTAERSDQHVTDVAKGLQVPPYEDVYPVKPWSWNCAHLPGRSIYRCSACGLVWIIMTPWE
jgi:hypothetical protein